MPAEAVNPGIVIDFGIYGIIVAVYAVVILVLAVLAVVALFKQKSLLNQISGILMRQSSPAPSYAPPAPNTCPACGVVHAPGAGFCQNCGTSLK